MIGSIFLVKRDGIFGSARFVALYKCCEMNVDRFNKLHPSEQCLMAWRFIPEFASLYFAPSYFDIVDVAAYPLRMARAVGING